MSIPKYDEMYSIFLSVISDLKDHSIKEIRNKIRFEINLSDNDLKEKSPNGTPLFNNRVNWTCTYLKQAGLIKNTSRGVYQITSEGINVLKDKSIVIDNEFLKRFDSFNDFISRSNKVINKTKLNYNEKVVIDNSLTPQDQMDRAFSEINVALIDEILLEVMNQSPEFFEHLVVKLLIKMGYGSSLDESAIVTKYSCDEGIDGIIREDKLGFNNIYIQAKRWDRDKTIGRPEIQKFVGALAGQGGNKGLFITTAQFTKEAKEYALKQHTTKVVLIDGYKLAQLMIDYNIGVSVESAYEIKKIDTDFFDSSNI